MSVSRTTVAALVLSTTVIIAPGCRSTHEGIDARARESNAPTPGGVDPNRSRPSTSQTPPPPSTPRRFASGAPSRRAVSLALGGRHTCARLDDEKVVCWGAGQLGQLGTETELEVCSTPDFTGPCARNPRPVKHAERVSRVAAGTATTCFVVGGKIRCAGAGPLGYTTPETCPRLPNPVPCFPLPDPVREIDNAVDLAVGGGHACAVLRTDRTLACWGDSSSLQLGREAGSVEAVALEGVSQVSNIDAGDRHTCVVVDGGVQCWGANDSGQLGAEPDEDAPAIAEPVTVPGLEAVSVIEVAAGDAHTCARLDDGTVRCWGSNERGQLGDGTFVSAFEPVQVTLPRAVLQLVAGAQFTCALLEDGDIHCWGANDEGQLGDGSRDDRGLPVVAEVEVAEAIAAGTSHTCAIVGDATHCWGANHAFQLARPQESESAQPGVIIW